MLKLLHVDEKCQILRGHAAGYLLTLSFVFLHFHFHHILNHGAKVRQNKTKCVNIFFQKRFTHPAKSSKMPILGVFLAVLTWCYIIKTLKRTAKRVGLVVTTKGGYSRYRHVLIVLQQLGGALHLDG